MGCIPRLFSAAVIAAFAFCGAAHAQDVTLSSRDGAFGFSGTLLAYDGEYYRVETEFGRLTVDGESVLCEGPACPSLITPKAIIRIVGASEAGTKILPPVLAAFAQSRGLVLQPASGTEPLRLVDPIAKKTLAEIGFQPMEPDVALTALAEVRADLVIGSVAKPEFGSQTIALDALVPIVSQDNPLAQITTPQLAKALAGEVKNWSEVGGPDMPLVLHGLRADSDLQRALSARLGREIAATVLHPDPASLATAVAHDPWALAITGQSSVGEARNLPLADSCGFALSPSAFSVKAQDYPLTLPVYVLTPRRRLPLIAREFLEFLASPNAQAAIEASGYSARAPMVQTIAPEGVRLINAIQRAGSETTLADLQRMVEVMARARRLSLTFRFLDGTNELDPASQDNLADLARLIEADMFLGQTLVLAGFSDGTGEAANNQNLSKTRADQVLQALQSALPEVGAPLLPQVEAFGEAMPIACDETAAGRQLNRRVEVWVSPQVLLQTP
jgi:phosphate transport system substrate-binding protein